MGPAPTLRRGRVEDADGVADVWLRSFRAGLPTVRLVHTEAEVRSWIRDVVLARPETWIVTLGDEIAGMMSIVDGDIDQLYLDPARRGQGLGDRCIAHAKSRRPDGLGLWTFQVNAPAIRFYERHGFQETQRTDGSHNEEREPDVRMEWHPISAATQTVHLGIGRPTFIPAQDSPSRPGDASAVDQLTSLA